MKVLILIATAMMTTMTLSPLISSIDGSTNDAVISDDVFAPGDHSYFNGSTSWNWQLDSIEDIDLSTNMELVDGEMRPVFNSSLISPVLKKVRTNFNRVQYSSGGHTLIARSGNTVFWAYSWKNGSNAQASIIASYDNGNTWTSPVDVQQKAIVGYRIGLFIWKDKLFCFFGEMSPTAANNKLHVKEAPLSSWTNIRTATMKTLLSDHATSFDLAFDNSYLYLSFTRGSQLEGYFYYHDGASWSSGIKVVNAGYCGFTGIEVMNYGGSTRILFFYGRQWASGAWADGDLHLKYSTNLGSSWSSEINVLDDGRDYFAPDCVNINGTLVVISNDYDESEDIYVTISRDGGSTWSDEIKIITQRGLNTLETSRQRDYTVNYIEDEKTIYVAYENSANDIDMVYSTDYGSNWVSESNAVQVEPVNSYDPKLCRDSKMITYMFDLPTDQDIRFRTLESYEPVSTATLTECSPPILNSWNSIGFDVNIPARTYVHYRILDGGDDTELQGWTNLSSLTPGQINGMIFNKTDTFTGSWANSNLASSIKVEIKMFSLGLAHPSVWEVHLDYSTSLPYDEDFDHLNWVESYDCHWEPGWMNYSGVGRSETFTTEPIELEDGESWPDTLLMDVYNVDASNNIKVGIIDASTGFNVPGFAPGDLNLITQPSSEATTILNWNGRFLRNLPSTVRAIQLEVIMTSSPNHQPPIAIDRIWMTDNLPPELLSIEANPDWDLFRTEWVEISVSVYDDIELPSELDCQLYYKSPDSLDWEQTLLSYEGVVDSHHFWNLSIPADAPLGEWEIMANVTDTFGNFSGDTISSTNITVYNNKPLPPEILFTMDAPLTSDEIRVILTAPGTDAELSEGELTYKYEWFKNSELYRVDENITDYFSVIPANESMKGDEWMVKVYTYDGLEFSDLANASVIVGNTVPFVNGTFGPYHFDEDNGTVQIDMHWMFYDLDLDELEFNVLLDVSYEFEILEGNILQVEIPANWNGQFTVNVSVSDGDLTNQSYFDVIIDPINDPPILNETGFLGAMEDEWFNTTFTGYDPYDGDNVTFSINATDVIPGLVEGENYFFYPNGSFHILPDNDMVGEYILNLSCDDGNGGVVWMNITLTIVNVNDAPNGTINEPIGPITIENGENVTFNATAIDIDSEELEISWIMEGGLLDITIGIGEEIVYTFIEDGTFNVTCFVSDGEEEIAIGTVMITVFTPPPDNTAPYDPIITASPDVDDMDPLDALDILSDWVLSREIPSDIPFTLTAAATDDEGDDLTYTWTIVEDPEWMMTGAEITIPADNLTEGTYTFKVTIDDGNDHIIEETLDPITIIGPYESISDTAKKGAALCMIIIIIVIVLFLLGLALLIFLIVRKKKKPEEEGEMVPAETLAPAPPVVGGPMQVPAAQPQPAIPPVAAEPQLPPPAIQEQPAPEQLQLETPPPVQQLPEPVEPPMQEMPEPPMQQPPEPKTTQQVQPPEQPTEPPQPATPPVQTSPEPAETPMQQMPEPPAPQPPVPEAPQPVQPPEQPAAPPQPPEPQPEQQTTTPQQPAKPEQPEE